MTNQIQLFNFRGEALEVSKQGDDLFVGLRRCCEALGVSTEAQAAKLKSKGWAVTAMIEGTGPDGKQYMMTALHLDSLPMWLATISETKVAEEVRPKLLAFQKEAARALADHFFGRRGSVMATPSPAALTEAEVERIAQRASQLAYARLATKIPARDKQAALFAIRYEGAPDTVALWTSSNCVLLPLSVPRREWTKASVAYNHYCAWCLDNAHDPIHNRAFLGRLIRMGMRPKRTSGCVFYSISILPLSTNGRANHE